MQEIDNKVKTQLVGMSKAGGDSARTGDAGAVLNDLTLKEAVENFGMGLKADLLALFEDDRKLKNIRF